jgi:hypothetical protein
VSAPACGNCGGKVAQGRCRDCGWPADYDAVIAALDAIAELMDGAEWGADLAGQVAAIVRGTGREIRDVA